MSRRKAVNPDDPQDEDEPYQSKALKVEWNDVLRSVPQVLEFFKLPEWITETKEWINLIGKNSKGSETPGFQNMISKSIIDKILEALASAPRDLKVVNDEAVHYWKQPDRRVNTFSDIEDFLGHIKAFHARKAPPYLIVRTKQLLEKYLHRSVRMKEGSTVREVQDRISKFEEDFMIVIKASASYVPASKIEWKNLGYIRCIVILDMLPLPARGQAFDAFPQSMDDLLNYDKLKEHVVQYFQSREAIQDLIFYDDQPSTHQARSAVKVIKNVDLEIVEPVEDGATQESDVEEESKDGDTEAAQAAFRRTALKSSKAKPKPKGSSSSPSVKIPSELFKVPGYKGYQAFKKWMIRNQLCFRCGQARSLHMDDDNYILEKCPAFDKDCSICSKKGHFKSCCGRQFFEKSDDSRSEAVQLCHQVDQYQAMALTSLNHPGHPVPSKIKFAADSACTRTLIPYQSMPYLRFEDQAFKKPALSSKYRLLDSGLFHQR